MSTYDDRDGSFRDEDDANEVDVLGSDPWLENEERDAPSETRRLLPYSPPLTEYGAAYQALRNGDAAKVLEFVATLEDLANEQERIGYSARAFEPNRAEAKRLREAVRLLGSQKVA